MCTHETILVAEKYGGSATQRILAIGWFEDIMAKIVRDVRLTGRRCPRRPRKR